MSSYPENTFSHGRSSHEAEKTWFKRWQNAGTHVESHVKAFHFPFLASCDYEDSFYFVSQMIEQANKVLDLKASRLQIEQVMLNQRVSHKISLIHPTHVSNGNM